MLLSRIRRCFVIATLLISGIVSAGEPVILELKSGRSLQAQVIEADSASPDRVVLTIQKPSIQIRRSVAWSQISRLSAPAAQLAALQVPEDVQVTDRSESLERRPIVPQPAILVDGIPPSPTAIVELPNHVAGITPGGAIIKFGCVSKFRDPGVIVGVRERPIAVRTYVPLSVTAPRP